MLMTLDVPHLTWLFLATVFALAMAFVWLFCELERRYGTRLGSAVLARLGHRRESGRDRPIKRRDD
ncbi:MAG: hypothetical protein JWR89_1286 [Tardiphaga sp.]|uniref:hypothetical protein n=1 Tax=Tardiphaga sp. TaxID=1926292 RepID=UPI002622441D|nr:hypothetical protein [Tardiphaga sp.]MDB5501384.1 hypothetical protein [Tardiphaga sp.]